jgi:hypothetical protein
MTTMVEVYEQGRGTTISDGHERFTNSTLWQFGADGEFTMRQAVSGEDRLKSWNLVYKTYVGLGYMQEQALPYRYSMHDALPDTGTFFVDYAATTIATVTVFPDSPLGLPAEEKYATELDELRAGGRRPVEVGRLTIGNDYLNNREVLTGLFDVLSLFSRCIRGATDLVITVNPRHVKFYERMLLFDVIGREKELDSVCGAPAVLLRLDLELQKAAIRWSHGEGAVPKGFERSRTFYRYFSTALEELERVARLKECSGTLGRDFLERYFAKECQTKAEPGNAAEACFLAENGLGWQMATV